MTEMTNMIRAELAREACHIFAPADAGDDLATVIADLIANLMHLAAQEDIDVDRCLERARMHYDAEILEEGSDA